MNSGGVPAGTGSGNARSRGGSAAGVGEFGSGGDGGDCGAGRISVDGISGAAFSGAGVTGTGRDAELGTVGRPRRGADGRRLARSRGSRRAFERRRADTAGCVRRVGSGAPEFASLPAGACSFTGSSMSSTASAVASTIAAAAQTARGKRMPDRGRPPCVAVCGRFCPRTCFARRCAATADRVRAALCAVARFAEGLERLRCRVRRQEDVGRRGRLVGFGVVRGWDGHRSTDKRSERRKWPPASTSASRSEPARRMSVTGPRGVRDDRCR